jgi:hypothetical protein
VYLACTRFWGARRNFKTALGQGGGAIGGTMFKLAKHCIVVWAIALGAAHAACPKVGFTVVEPQATAETRPLKVGGNQTIFVRREPITTTGDIIDIKLAGGGGNDDDATLQIKFTAAADQRLHDATTNHSGMRLAFLFDDEVLINVVWEGPYGADLGGSQVSVQHGLKQAQSLMRAIRGCTAATAANK